MLFFRAASRPHRVRPLFQLVDRGEVVISLSADVLAEIRDVLSRPRLAAKFPALTPQAVDAFLAQYLRVARWADAVPEHYVLVRDPKDSKYLNLAIEMNVPYVVTDDKDMLDLMDPASAAGQDFRTRYPAIRVITPAEFLAVARAATP